MKLDIRVARGTGGTHLVRSVDEVDLPWLLDLISELQIESSAVVTLTNTVLGDELVINIDRSRYHVERSAAGIRIRLAVGPQAAPSPASAATEDGWAAAEDGSVDLAAARVALRSVILEKPLEAGLRWAPIDG